MAVMKWDKSPSVGRAQRAEEERPGRPLFAERHRAIPEQAERSDLLATIETEIIPRLILAHRGDPANATSCAVTRPPPSAEEVFEFARIAACHDLTSALAFVEALCREGLSLEQVLLELAAPAARLLGEQWMDDLRSFTDVSAGLGTLQQLVHVLGPSFAPSVPHRGLVVLCAAPGEQHTLGLYLIAEFLRRAGWGVQVSPAIDEDELLDLLAHAPVAMVGFTVSNDKLLPGLAALLARVRTVIRDKATPVLVGGPIELQAFAQRTGVTLAGGDPRDAVRYLEFRDKGGH